MKARHKNMKNSSCNNISGAYRIKYMNHEIKNKR